MLFRSSSNLLQVHNLEVGEETPLATGKFVLVKTSKHDTVELGHFVTKMFEDTAYNAIAARMKFDTDALLAVVILIVCYIVGSDRAIISLNAFGNTQHVVLGQRFVKNDVIEFRDLAARMSQFLGQIAIVGE